MDGRVIMGIDPGTNTTGYGVIRTEGNALSCIVLGDIDLHRIGDPYQKLKYIFERVGALIDQYRPDEVALESPFFGENVQSMLKLGRAQGVAMAAALSRGVTVSEYAPRQDQAGDYRSGRRVEGTGRDNSQKTAAIGGAAAASRRDRRTRRRRLPLFPVRSGADARKSLSEKGARWRSRFRKLGAFYFRSSGTGQKVIVERNNSESI